jgi:hypothetical protein
MNEKPVAVPLLLCCLGPIILSSALAGLGGSLGALDSRNCGRGRRSSAGAYASGAVCQPANSQPD